MGNIGTSYKQNAITGSYDVIVIGSGIGGLGVAALLTKHAGKRVLVLERHYTAGGFTHTFHRPGYEWDVGVHYVGDLLNPESQFRLLMDDVTDAQLEWSDMGEVYDRIIIGNDTYDFVKGREPFRERMQSYFPSEKQAIDRYLKEIDTTTRRAGLYFAEKTLPLMLSRCIGGLLRWPLLSKAKRTTLETLSSITNNKRLIGVLTAQYGDYGLPPSQSSFFIHASIVRHYLEGAAYPVGGSANIAKTILSVIEGGGGAVYTNAEVGQILVENNQAVGVRLADGHAVRAATIISDAGAYNTFQHMLPSSARLTQRFDGLASRQVPSCAHISLYVGLKQTASELGLTPTNLWVYPDDDHDGNFRRLTTGPDAPLAVAYISFPSAKDPDFEWRHPGRATLEIVSLAPYSWFEKWQGAPWKKRGAEYETLKARLTEQLLETLYTQLPQLRGKIDFHELSTPLTTSHFTGHPRGAIYGLAATPARYRERWLRPQTPLRNLYLTGTDICSLGIAGALFGGLLTASAIQGRYLGPKVAASAKASRTRSSREKAKSSQSNQANAARAQHSS